MATGCYHAGFVLGVERQKAAGLSVAMPTGIFSTWDYKVYKAEQVLHNKMKKNHCYPFTLEKPNVFVMDYLHDDLWKGLLLLLASVIGSGVYLSGHEDSHEFAAFFVLGLCLGVWFTASASFQRRLIIDHHAGVYRFYILQQLRQQGALNQIYIRTKAKRSGQGHLFYTLIINGYKIEEQQVCGFSENYEVLETLGKRMATRLNINYFDHIDISTRHLVTHWPKHQDTAEELKFTV
ncbi:transmembrane protein 249-like [Huso huso]|uniref:Transmembrane protein 249-like n=1 Tax=Huso huso TaxID=61971 RepID=A0ABR1A2E9_HUSHU